MERFSAAERQRALERMAQETFDLVIVGGGINGAGIARAAALRGYSVALLEQRDLGSGTSSRSSRLIHGGLRYLEHAEFRLVFESLAERAALARVARHLVRPLPFVFPVYEGDRLGLTRARLGIFLYDLLALFRNFRRHRGLSPEAVARRLPQIRRQGLRGALAYYDYRTDDARLVLENVLAAAAAGAAVASYTPVLGIDSGGGTKEIHARDLVGRRELTVRGRVVICAAGPWTDRVLQIKNPNWRWLEPTKGVHLVLPRERLPIDSALVMQHPDDARVVFALPFCERTVIGTTDTRYAGDPLRVRTTANDVAYLLGVAAHYFPEARMSEDDVIANWAGVRPLLRSDADDPGAASREHRLKVRDDGVVVIAGGKLTTYRRMADECVKAAAWALARAGGPPPRRAVPAEAGPLPGAEGLQSEAELERLVGRLAGELEDRRVARQLAHSYGVRALELSRMVAGRPELGQPIAPELPYIWAQVPFAARHELALSLSDVLVRGTQVFYRDRDQGLQ
ncbi:MAG: glycerol-3-phosphate dehydrogenase/oxidase, partial [Myxococcales bacterium]